MTFTAGILFALTALFFWGFGDFLIQRSTRKIGDWETLFVITLFGVGILTPFVYSDLRTLFLTPNILVLTTVSATLLVAALLDFEALKVGRIAIVEPILALEVPVAVILAFSIVNETVELFQVFLISMIVLGIVLLSLRSHHFSKKHWIEKGVVLIVLGSIFMGVSNTLVGFASRITNPLITNWFISLFILLISLFYLASNKRLHKLVYDFELNKKLILTVSAIDNLAWISFAFALSLIPIAIAVALTENYITLAALLGLIINKERLMLHQKSGLVLALLSAVGLVILTL